MVQAIPETVIPEWLPTRKHEIAVCRGIPDTNKAFPITAACIHAFRDLVLTTCAKTRIVKKEDTLSKKFVILLGYVEHKLIEVKPTGQGGLPTFRTLTDVEKMQKNTRGRENSRDSSKKRTPKYTVIRELVLRAVWTGELFGEDLTLLHYLSNEFTKKPIIPFSTW